MQCALLSNFRNQVIHALRALAAANDKDSQGTGDCCICLGQIGPFQALFIAPCCHSFHYKCCRPLLAAWPNFSCPLCRHFADLSISVSMEDLNSLALDGGEPEQQGKHSTGVKSDGARQIHGRGIVSHTLSAANSHVEDHHDGRSLPVGPSIGPTPVVSFVAENENEQLGLEHRVIGLQVIPEGLHVPNELSHGSVVSVSTNFSSNDRSINPDELNAQLAPDLRASRPTSDPQRIHLAGRHQAVAPTRASQPSIPSIGALGFAAREEPDESELDTDAPSHYQSSNGGEDDDVSDIENPTRPAKAQESNCIQSIASSSLLPSSMVGTSNLPRSSGAGM
jgi:hypothetical protein